VPPFVLEAGEQARILLESTTGKFSSGARVLVDCNMKDDWLTVVPTISSNLDLRESVSRIPSNLSKRSA
jgi:hypothetical protein